MSLPVNLDFQSISGDLARQGIVSPLYLLQANIMFKISIGLVISMEKHKHPLSCSVTGDNGTTTQGRTATSHKDACRGNFSS